MSKPATQETAPAFDQSMFTQTPMDAVETAAYSAEEEVARLRAELAELQTQSEAATLRRQISEMRGKNDKLSAAPVPVRDDPERDDPKTWILVQYSQNEAAISDEWLERYAPLKHEQQMVENVLNLDMLREDDKVICMIRGKRRVTPLDEVFVNSQGEKISTQRPKEDLLSEMVLSVPIHCCDYWQRNPEGRGSRRSGHLKQPEFVEAVGKVCSPLAPRFLDVTATAKDELPRKLILREC